MAFKYSMPAIMPNEEDYDISSLLRKNNVRKNFYLLLTDQWILALAMFGNKGARSFIRSSREEANAEDFNE